MGAFATGVGMGVGFVMGLLMIVLFLTITVWALWKLYVLSERRQFSAPLFRRYGKELLRQERFEELGVVQQIIKELETNGNPQELLRDYEVELSVDLDFVPINDGEERLQLSRERRIVRRKTTHQREK